MLTYDLYPQQQFALNSALNGENVIIIGPACSDKSVTINAIMSEFDKRSKTYTHVIVDFLKNEKLMNNLGNAILFSQECEPENIQLYNNSGHQYIIGMYDLDVKYLHNVCARLVFLDKIFPSNLKYINDNR